MAEENNNDNLDSRLSGLICGQVAEFIEDVLRQEKVDNDARIETLKTYPPMGIQGGGRLSISNDPSLTTNLIDRMNTPFDHLDRILLQDFSNDLLGGEDGGGFNWFKSQFKVNEGGIVFTDGKLQIKGLEDGRTIPGEFSIDSFTYVPFIDNSSSDETAVGSYSDLFLNDYNSGVFLNPENQVDINRHPLSSTMFRMGNLDRDLYDAKISFRESIDRTNPYSETDAKVYIYTFCEHLASLFARLSNIRMCHEVYGLKHPHVEWEGILALDIWYQSLYRAIDGQYMFDEGKFNMNPMSRRRVQKIDGVDKVEWKDGEYLSRTQIEQLGLEWIEDSSSPDHAYIWDSNLWSEYKSNSIGIHEGRKDCTTPRCVLAKIYAIVNGGLDGKSTICNRDEGGDFSWFHQNGNVYSDSSKSMFTRYANLHLGRAWERMSAREYCDLAGVEAEDGAWRKPDFRGDFDLGGKSILVRMLEKGVDALSDAFSVALAGHVFNVFNSSTNQIEEFNPDNSRSYSQGQCAIAIERVFSCIYKYLQFKSTTHETFARHVNIDSGYRYLTTQSILGTDNLSGRHAYYDDSVDDEGDSTPDYLGYLDKVSQYLDPESDILDENQKRILKQFVAMLSCKSFDWFESHWDLCPLLQNNGWIDFVPRGNLEVALDVVKASMRGMLNPRDVGDESSDSVEELADDAGSAGDQEGDLQYRAVYIYFNVGNGLTWDGMLNENEKFTVFKDHDGKTLCVKYSTVESEDSFSMSLSDVVEMMGEDHLPKYVYGTGADESIGYELIGFSTNPDSYQPEFQKNQNIIAFNFQEGRSTFVLYAIWKPKKMLVRYDSGEYQSQYVQPSDVIVFNSRYVLPSTEYGQYLGDELKLPRLTYLESPSGIWKNNIDALNRQVGEKVAFVGFNHWEWNVGDSRYSGRPGDTIQFNLDQHSIPVVTISAQWRVLYDRISFMVGSDEHSPETYCQVLVDRDDPILDIYPEPPEIDESNRFLGWNVKLGTWLPGITRNEIVVCDDGEVQPDSSSSSSLLCVCCDSSSSSILLCHDEVLDYDMQVVARYGYLPDEPMFKVTFNFKDEDGRWVNEDVLVNENHHLPQFHIHQTIDVDIDDDGNVVRQLVFRYWRLSSGNLSSSRTVLSDIVLDAVYDEIESVVEGGDQLVDSSIGILEVGVAQQDVDGLEACSHQSSLLNREGCPYCTLSVQDPRKESMETLSEQCPYIHLLNSTRRVSCGDGFSELSEIGVSDVSELIKALFKINIDIANNERFVKIDIPQESNWWYGYRLDGWHIVCGTDGTPVICGDEDGDVVCGDGKEKWISFEPTVEYKFSNFHAANQRVVGQELVCGFDDAKTSVKSIVPINRELWNDAGADHFNGLYYFHDYIGQLKRVVGSQDKDMFNKDRCLFDRQKYYQMERLQLHENMNVQSPTSTQEFVLRHRGAINRDSTRQISTFATIVKKYRPMVMPAVEDLFDICHSAPTKYDADQMNSYGVFGWCTIPSKTMVDMEYNEHAIIVPSSYDCHNRIGGSNFLQIDADLYGMIYKGYDNGEEIDLASESWYYLYNSRDWTYFMYPVFGKKRNNDIYSSIKDVFPQTYWPSNSNHLNGVIYESIKLKRNLDSMFGDMVKTCQFLAKRHHNRSNLVILSERYTNMVSYGNLVKLTQDGDDKGFNSMYGSEVKPVEGVIPDMFHFPEEDWVDDCDLTSSNVLQNADGSFRYRYNIGQAHAIDDFDENSVWFYITMVEPIQRQDDVIEVKDIMPFVFWWDNRGVDNNGPTVDCYGRQSNAKLNYDGGYCHSSGYKINGDGDESEQSWHAVQHTLGMDFSQESLGGTILTTDNSGNVYKGAFDPQCSGTDEKWKVSDKTNAFGVNQHQDPSEDRYYHGDKAHGDAQFKGANVPDGMNADILKSIEGRPMAWNLWNVIRHYVYIKEFKGMGKSLGSDAAAWEELETRTRKIVKDIYRTFKAHQRQSGGGRRSTFTDVDGSISNYGGNCLVQWTNSFVEIHSVLERNAREHQASLVMFTGDMGKGASADDLRRDSHNFRITTMDGVDGDEDGMPDSISSNVVSYGELPSSYTIGGQTFQQRTMDMVVDFGKPLDLDQEYPFAEYLKNDQTQKWVRKITEATMNRQMFPVYTSMETMEDKDVHQVTDEELKGITFQVVPNLYWKYEWSYNEFMVHRVGRLSSPSTDIVMYDMLGNVWEWVRDDWSESRNAEPESNPIVGTSQPSSTAPKVIRGGAFDQLCRKVISSSREGLEPSRCNSSGGSHANVGFRPSFQYTTEKWQAGSGDDDQPVDLFFLFDASASQNASMDKMLEEAKKIVEGYAGRGEEGKDKCHVGTALFLGPTIQLMCSSRVKNDEDEPLTFSQTVWGYKKDTEPSSTTSSKAVNPSNCPYKNPSNDKTWKPSNVNGSSYNSWISMNDGDNALAGTGADGKSHGLLKQFRDYKNNIWDSEQASGRSLDDASAMMVSRGDSPSNPSSGGSSSQTVPSGSGGSNGTLTTRTFFKKVQKMNVFTGASVYKDMDSDELKFEDDVPFFTYDMSRDGLKDFKLPFIPNSDGRGALSNFFGGCEPICHTLDSLLKDGVFFDYPFNDCIGYLFRKNAKRVVFVFTDEFDNEYRRAYTYWKKETAVSSQTQGSVDIKTFTKKTVSSYEWQTVPAINSSRNVQFTTVKLSTKVAEPPDPYCVQQMAIDGFKDNLKDYLEYIVKLPNEYDVDGYMETMGIFGFTDDGNVNFTRYPIYSDDSYSTPYKSNLALKNVLNSSTKVGSIILASWNFSLLAGGTLKNGLAQKILTDNQLEELDTNKKFSYYELVDGKLHARYDQTQSIGFYELNRTVRDMAEPTCVYLMATDGSSSMRLYDPEECINYSQEHGVLLDSTQQDDMRLASIFVHNNMDLFNHIKGNKTTGLKSGGKDVAAGNVKNTSTLVSIPQSCAAWWASRNPSSYPSAGSLGYTTKYSATVSGKTTQKDGGHPCSTIGRVQNILGLENPYTKNTMVFANRIENISFVSDANILKQFYFIVGLPCGYLHGRPTGWRAKCSNVPKNYFTWSGTGNGWKNTFLGELCPSGTTLDFNRIKAICNHVYSSLNKTGISYEPLPEDDPQVEWIDWHMCPRHEKTWKDATRVDSRTPKMCMYNLDQDNIELFGISIVLNISNQSVTMGFAKDWQLHRLFSSKSYGMTTQYTMKYVRGMDIKESDLSGTGLDFAPWLTTYTTSSATRALAGASSNTHMIQSGIHDYITLDYKDAENNRTGAFKVVVFNDLPKALDNETVNITTSDKNKNKLVSNFVMDGWSIMLDNNDGRSIYSDLMERQSDWPYPASYQKLITNYCISMNVGDWKSNWLGDATYGTTQTTKKLYEWVGDFYDGMHALMPLLMSYRYHEHIFSQMTNHNGESCVEYGDGNDVWFKALPIIDVDAISQLVDIVPLATSNGNLAYTHAIVDLNPSLDRYPGLHQGEFPISFANDIQIEGDEFKTTSIVFQKIDSISAGKSNTFTMGSRETDYDDVEDGPRKTYKSQDAIVDGAEDDYVEVTLGNGGSCQKNDGFYELQQESGEEDEQTQYKYFRNRHFFIDPFELTIAQWCYAHGKNNKPLARSYLGNRLQEMERSYWEYLSVWEKEEWAQLKENHVKEVDSSTSDRQFVDWLVSKGMYNPLEDTRPYYYATYNDIRGTGQVYQQVEGSSGSNYVIDSSKGDEFQMNSRDETTSFMDILNHKVVCLTEEREYTIDPVDGGEVVSVLEPEVKKWCSGKSGGLNFDLPTEAQWEYCCRGGNPNAIPTGFNLGTNFEEQDRNLDLIAWYKYKEIGKLPEPERYCTWRIAKLAFGIDTDSEQMNNVYEYSP